MGVVCVLRVQGCCGCGVCPENAGLLCGYGVCPESAGLLCGCGWAEVCSLTYLQYTQEGRAFSHQPLDWRLFSC